MIREPKVRWPALALLFAVACGDSGADGPDAIVTLRSPVPADQRIPPVGMVGVWERIESGDLLVIDVVEDTSMPPVSVVWKSPGDQEPQPFTAEAARVDSIQFLALRPEIWAEDRPSYIREYIAGFIPVKVAVEGDRLLFAHARPGEIWDRVTAGPDTLEHWVCETCTPGETIIVLTGTTRTLWERLVPVLADDGVYDSPEPWIRSDRSPRDLLIEWYPEFEESLREEEPAKP